MNLRIPGPTPCPPDVLAASAQPMVNHRGSEFANILGNVSEGLKWVFGTSSEVFCLTASGTGGLEAAIVNVLSPGDLVLSISIGSFGERFANIAKTYGANVETYAVEWGKAADPEEIAARLEANPNYKAILVTHNETSTGVTNPLKEIAEVAKSYDCLVIVDAVSSLSSIPCPVEEWGLDVVVSGSQKGWMSPPGLAFVWLSEKAWSANANATMPRFYFDLARAQSSLEKSQTPWTPALSVFFALDRAFSLIREEGLESIYERHRKAGELTRLLARQNGLELFADNNYASNTVTAIEWPKNVDGKKISNFAREKFNVVIGGGQGKLQGKIFRIGHLGYFKLTEIEDAILTVVNLLGNSTEG